jgi:hypothetical protein
MTQEMFQPILFEKRMTLRWALAGVALCYAALATAIAALPSRTVAPKPVVRNSHVALVAPLVPLAPHRAAARRPATPRRETPPVPNSPARSTPAIPTPEHPAASVRSGAGAPARSDFNDRFAHYADLGASGPTQFDMYVMVDAAYLDFLRAYDARVVFSPVTPLPGSPVLVLSARDGVTREDFVEADTITRRIQDPFQMPLPGFRAALERAAAYFHIPERSVGVFVLYPSRLLYAMRGKCVEGLRERRLDPASVRTVEVQYVAAGGNGYDVRLSRVDGRGEPAN